MKVWWACIFLIGCSHIHTYNFTPKPYDISITYRKCDKEGACQLVTETIKEDK